MKPIRILTVVVLALAAMYVVSGCRGIEYPHLKKQIYTLTNLHPDEEKRIMWSVNYQRNGLIPRCTPVTIFAMNRDQVRLKNEATGQIYIYRFHHKSMKTTIPEHLDKFFGPKCDAKVLENMSDIDKQGIAEGKVYRGMSKQAVILAIGYPPEHETPNLDDSGWKYWSTRIGTFMVYFQDDLVTEVY